MWDKTFLVLRVDDDIAKKIKRERWMVKCIKTVFPFFFFTTNVAAIVAQK